MFEARRIGVDMINLPTVKQYAGPAPANPDVAESLYIHIPFCPAKCPYCAFVTHVGSLKLIEPYLDALVMEAEMVAGTAPLRLLHTVYLGGGTPSMLSPDQLRRLLAQVDRIFGLAAGAEISLEAHPDTVDRAKLAGFRQAGATRISFGGESLQSSELVALGRTHGRSRVLSALEEAREVGFDDINVDFMYGLPGQTAQSWEATLEAIVAAGPDHLSLYPLSIEPRTVFARLHDRNRLELPPDDLVVDMYYLACTRLARAGYEHYEIANWSLPGHQSRHNLAYWYNRDFFAIGVGAHGYLRPYRFENLTQTGRYIETVLGGGSPRKSTIYIDNDVECTETVMLRLRLLGDGLDTCEIQKRYGLDLLQRFAADIEILTEANLLRITDQTLYLDETAVPVANEVWSRFVL